MIVAAYALVALLGFQEPTPATTHGPSCALEDHRCKASLYLQRARKAATPKERALHLFAAHRTFLALFDQAGKAVDLCAARRAFEQSIEVEGQPDTQRASFEALREELAARERQRGVRCGPSRVPKTAPPMVAEAASAGPAATTRAPSADEVSATESAGPPRTSPLLEPTQEQLTPVVATSRAPAMTRPATAPRPGRGLVIAGGTTLGVGLALSSVAGYMGGRLLGTWRDAQDLHEEAGRYGTAEQIARDVALAHEYQRLRGPTLAMALVGGSTVVLGAVLVGVGAKRLARIASRTALVPTLGGLVFRARF